MPITINIPAINILLMDDHSLVAEGLKELLIRMLPERSTINVFNDVDKAKESIKTVPYDFVISDLIMPGQKVLDFISKLHVTHPEIIILIISSVIDFNTIKQCMAIGINGYISKGIIPAELKVAFENTYKGLKYISSDLSGKLANSVLFNENTTLTKREIEVLRLIAAGHNTKIIAEMLIVSPITIMTHKRSIMQKLDIHSVAGLVKYTYDNQLV